MRLPPFARNGTLIFNPRFAFFKKMLEALDLERFFLPFPNNPG